MKLPNRFLANAEESNFVIVSASGEFENILNIKFDAYGKHFRKIRIIVSRQLMATVYFKISPPKCK